MTDTAATPRRHRLEVRVTPERDALIRQAADLQKTSVTAFVLDTVTRRARKVLKDHDTIVLSNAAFDRFLVEVDRPAQAVPELVELVSIGEPRVERLDVCAPDQGPCHGSSRRTPVRSASVESESALVATR